MSDTPLPFATRDPRLPEIVPADPADAAPLAETLADAFEADPVWSWLLPDDASRKARLKVFFAAELSHVALEHRLTFATAERTAVCACLPPGHWRLPLRLQALHFPAFARAFGARLPVALRTSTRMEQRHLRSPHVYVAFVAVTPALQGRGLGEAVMRPAVDRADAEGLPCYLEASTARSAALYERLGFRLLEDFRLGKDAPPLLLMVRPAPGR